MNQLLEAVGGITNYSSGNINNCCNNANISLKVTEGVSVSVGGICSSNGVDSTINGCYNTAKIEGYYEDGIMYVGGIMGNSSSSSGINRVINCYNIGKLSGESKTLRIGGIVGYLFSTVENCYNIAEIEGKATEELFLGMVVGRTFDSNAIVNNCYYKKIGTLTGIGNRNDTESMAQNEETMKSESFVQLLNQDAENIWKQDINNINNGYPILSWE